MMILWYVYAEFLHCGAKHRNELLALVEYQLEPALYNKHSCCCIWKGSKFSHDATTLPTYQLVRIGEFASK
jgi:hypothetical protein